jgi:hypothetical protein
MSLRNSLYFLKGKNSKNDEENFTVRIFTICTHNQIANNYVYERMAEDMLGAGVWQAWWRK